MAQIIGPGIQIFTGSESAPPPPATVTGAESGTGLVGTKVRLGINPLLQDTEIDGSGFNFDIIQRTNANTFTRFLIDSSKNGIAQVAQISLGTFVATSIIKSATFLSWNQFISKAGVQRAFTNASNITAMSLVDDIDDIGMIGYDGSGIAHLFPVAQPEQYAQYGNLGIFASPSPILGRLLSGSQTVATIPTPGAQETQYFLNVSLFISTVGSGTILNLTYQDSNTNMQTVQLCTSAGGVATSAAISFIAAPLSNIVLSTIGGTDIYTVAGMLTPQQNFA